MSLAYLFFVSNCTEIFISLPISGTVGQGFSNVLIARFSVFVGDVAGNWDNSILAEL